MKKILILLLATLCAAPGYGQSKKKVAVYVTGEADAATKKVIGAKMVAAITKDNEYAAVERTADFLAELSKEQDYQRSGAVADNQITQLGRQFGVAFVCVADISNLYGSLFVAARMINVQTGLVTATAEGDKEISGMADLTELSDDVADGLINDVAPCNKKDKPVDKKGCCEGLTDVGGVCRDLSGDIYWLPKSKCPRTYLARTMPKVAMNERAICPAGYRVADSEDIQCLVDNIQSHLWVHEPYYWVQEDEYVHSRASKYVWYHRKYRAYTVSAEIKSASYASDNDPPMPSVKYSYLCVRE
jgi:hypothetical protein